MIKVLGIDLASSSWESNGSALLAFEPGAECFSELIVPAIEWPYQPLTPARLASSIGDFARRHAVSAVSLDGPQGWRDPSTPQGTPGVGRRCECECRTQGKTGVFGQTYPRTQRSWFEFSIAVFDSLLSRPDVALAKRGASRFVPSSGFVLLESFPTAAWRSSGLPPLPGKSRKPALEPFAQALFATYGIPFASNRVRSHDDLQAVVAALTAAAVVGGPARPEPRGVSAVDAQLVDGTQIRLEGLIWNVRPLREVMGTPAHYTENTDEARTQLNPSLVIPRVRVTQSVLDQVARLGPSQAQIALKSFPRGSGADRLTVQIQVDGASYGLVVGDTTAAWRAHQVASTSDSFEILFAWLSDRPDQWFPAEIVSGDSVDGCTPSPDER